MHPSSRSGPEALSPSRALVLVYLVLAHTLLVLPGEPLSHLLRGGDSAVVTLAFVGDVMLGRGVAEALGRDWEAAFVEVRPWLAGADLAWANLESPLTTEPRVTDGRDLRVSPDAVYALGAASFDVVGLSNNHALDAGVAGLLETRRVLQKAAIAPVLDSPVRQALLPVSLVFLAFDDTAGRLDMEAVREAVSASARATDFVIVSMHWGAEYQVAPTVRQRAIATDLANAGVHLVIGHGPHVLQRVEWMGDTLVAYSLGNFLFDQPYPIDCRQGAILWVTLHRDRIVEVGAIPTIATRGRARLARLTDAAAILARLDLERASMSHYRVHQPGEDQW